MDEQYFEILDTLGKSNIFTMSEFSSMKEDGENTIIYLKNKTEILTPYSFETLKQVMKVHTPGIIEISRLVAVL